MFHKILIYLICTFENNLFISDTSRRQNKYEKRRNDDLLMEYYSRFRIYINVSWKSSKVESKKFLESLYVYVCEYYIKTNLNKNFNTWILVFNFKWFIVSINGTSIISFYKPNPLVWLHKNCSRSYLLKTISKYKSGGKRLSKKLQAILLSYKSQPNKMNIFIHIGNNNAI